MRLNPQEQAMLEGREGPAIATGDWVRVDADQGIVEVTKKG